jgi:hypothetical protein
MSFSRLTRFDVGAALSLPMPQFATMQNSHPS